LLPLRKSAADDAAMIAGHWFEAIDVKQTVPSRRIEPEIAVGYRPLDRMMHQLHLRRDHVSAHDGVKPRRQRHDHENRGRTAEADCYFQTRGHFHHTPLQ
jgi:hypothetical protein